VRGPEFKPQYWKKKGGGGGRGRGRKEEEIENHTYKVNSQVHPVN
jgi:hypothetical protein